MITQKIFSGEDLSRWTAAVNEELADGWRVADMKISICCSRNDNGYTSNSSAFVAVLKKDLTDI